MTTSTATATAYRMTRVTTKSGRTETFHTATLWQGPSRYTGKPVALMAEIGGNGKTGDVISVAVVPLAVVYQCRQEYARSIDRAGDYIKGLVAGSIDDVCHDDCDHKARTSGETDGPRKCYAQHTQQNAQQPANMAHRAPKLLRATEANLRACVRKLAAVARALFGFAKFRLMVAGSSAALPENVWAWLESAIRAANGSFLGYVEDRTATWLQRTHMLSVQNRAEIPAMEAAGWRCFLADVSAEAMPRGATLCPSSSAFETFRGFSLSCDRCGMCNGSDGGRRHVYNPRHGAGDHGMFQKLAREAGGSLSIVTFKGRVVGRIDVAPPKAKRKAKRA
jgi:hypothetical protein